MQPRSHARCEEDPGLQGWDSRCPPGGLLFSPGNCHGLLQTVLLRLDFLWWRLCVLTWRFETAFPVRDGGLSEVFILNDRIMPTQLYILYAHFLTEEWGHFREKWNPLIRKHWISRTGNLTPSSSAYVLGGPKNKNEDFSSSRENDPAARQLWKNEAIKWWSRDRIKVRVPPECGGASMST